MDIWGITLAVLRRWYVFVIIFVLSLGVAFLAGQGVQPEYRASASGLLTPPLTEAEVTNPLGTQDDANAVLLIVLNSPEVATELREMGHTSSYDVSAAARTSIFEVSARGEDEEDTVSTVADLLVIADRELAARQVNGGVPEGNRIGLSVLSQPALVEVDTEGALRIRVIVVVLGGAIGVIVAVLYDDLVGLLRRRRERLAERARQDEELAATADTEATEDHSEQVPAEHEDSEPGNAAPDDPSAAAPWDSDNTLVNHEVPLNEAEPAKAPAPQVSVEAEPSEVEAVAETGKAEIAAETGKAEIAAESSDAEGVAESGDAEGTPAQERETAHEGPAEQLAGGDDPAPFLEVGAASESAEVIDAAEPAEGSGGQEDAGVDPQRDEVLVPDDSRP